MGQGTCSNRFPMDSTCSPMTTHSKYGIPSIHPALILTDLWAKYLLTCFRIQTNKMFLSQPNNETFCSATTNEIFSAPSFLFQFLYFFFYFGQRSYRCEGGPTSNWFPRTGSHRPWPIFCNLDFYLLSGHNISFLRAHRPAALLFFPASHPASSAYRKEVHEICVKCLKGTGERMGKDRKLAEIGNIWL